MTWALATLLAMLAMADLTTLLVILVGLRLPRGSTGTTLRRQCALRETSMTIGCAGRLRQDLLPLLATMLEARLGRTSLPTVLLRLLPTHLVVAMEVRRRRLEMPTIATTGVLRLRHPCEMGPIRRMQALFPLGHGARRSCHLGPVMTMIESPLGNSR
jgi:hypothetical protein